MRRTVALIVLALLAVIAVYGFIHEDLFVQELWKSGGLERWAYFTIAFWAIAGMVLWKRPQWLLPTAVVFVFAYSEVWCWLFFDPLAPLAVAYFLGSCYFLGRFVARASDAITALLLGLAVWIFLISIAVHFPVNHPVVYAVAFAIPYLAARREPVRWPEASWQWAILLYVAMMHWLVALKPEVSSDGLAMHLAIPEMIARDSRFAFDFQHYAWSLMPMSGDFAFSAVYLMGGEIAARLLNFSLLAVIVAIVYRESRRWLSPDSAALAAALFASTPLVQLVTGSLFVENVWAVFIVGSIAALWRKELVWAAILFGAAFATKVGTTAFLVPALVVIVWTKPRLRTAGAALALFVVFAAPPYLNAWIKTGNPIFPFANDVFHSPYFDMTVALKDVRYQTPGTWDALYNVTFRSPGFLEGQKGALGFQYFLLLLPVLFLLNRKAPRMPILIGIAGAILTFASLPNLRYLYPALPLVSIGIAWMMAEIPWMAIATAGLIALNLWFLPSSGWYHNEFAVFTESQLDDYLRTTGPVRQVIDDANRVARGQPVAVFQIAAIAGLQSKAYVDTWHTFKFSQGLKQAPDAAHIAGLFQTLGIRYLITPMPPETNLAPVSQFVETWTAPTGRQSGRYQLRSLLAAPLTKVTEKQPAPPGIYEDTDPRVEFTGSWLPDHQFAQASAASITYSGRAGDVARLFFNGASITYVYTMALNRGIVEVSIDRAVRARVDLYSKETRWQQKKVFDNLEPGPHTIELRVTGEKNARSSGTYVDLDRFAVTGR